MVSIPNFKSLAMNQILKYLALFVSLLSLVSLFQQFFTVGLSGVFSSVLEYYRLVVSGIFKVFNIDVPQTLLDLWTISFITSAAYLRTENIENSRLLHKIDVTSLYKHWKIIYFFILGFFFIGLAILFSMLTPQTYVDEMNESPNDLIKGAVSNLVLVVSALILFFALNAYAPSL